MELFRAIENKDGEAVYRIARHYADSGDFINWRNPSLHHITSIHYAANNGMAKILEILVSTDQADVNLKCDWDCTPFYHACWNNKVECVKVLLRNERTDVNLPRKQAEGDVRTPLEVCIHNNRIEVIKHWIASGREMEFGTGQNSAFWIAERWSREVIAPLLKRFRAFPEKVREEVRKEIGWGEEEV
jgi:hypothetical protein